MARANYCPKYNCVIKSAECPHCGETHGQKTRVPKQKSGMKQKA